MNPPTKTRRPVTPEGQAAAGRIAEFRQNVNNGATAPQARATVNQITTPVAPAPVPTASTISATSLAPATPMKLATPVPATQAQGMMAEFTDGVDTYTQNLQDQAKALEAPKTNALNDYITQLTTAQGTTGLTNDAYAIKGGVNDITPELNDINDKIRREQLSLRRRIEAINNNGGGLASGAQSEISNIERDSFAKQADLSIIQQAVQGRYDSAKEIADRAVSAQLEKQTNDLAILKFNYDQNKSAFDKSEQRAFESAQADRERKLETERENKKSIYDLGIQASADGAPASVVQQMLQAKTREEALALGGSYIGALDRQAKYASIRSSNASAAMNEAQLVAYNKAQEDAANGILSPEQMKVANDVNKDFESQPIVKSYNEGLQKYMVLEDTLANGIDGVQDLQLVYDFMKSVDPESVVRETEFANAAKTGNIFQGAYAGFNKKFGSGGFLPEQVKNDFIRAARASFDAKHNQYYNVKSEYTKRMNNTIGIDNGADYLTAYEASAPLTQVDFGIADSLSGATPEEIQEIMLMSQGLVGANLNK